MAFTPRIKATILMVIDVLNVRNQMEYQKSSWGKSSEQINDCTVRGLQEIMETEEGELLLALVDSYSYHSLLTMPNHQCLALMIHIRF